MAMDYKYDIIRGQKFDIGRTINWAKCDCASCDFMNCPKKNYVPRTKLHKYTVSEYIEYYSEDIKKGSFSTSGIADEITDDFMRLFTFPKGTYWRLDIYDCKNIELVTFSRGGRELFKGAISRKTGKILDFDFSKAQEKLALRISHAILKINEFMDGDN